jgi:predicted ATPase/class 3 adenylate cyclase
VSTRPTGTVTFLFTDIEGSTRLLAQLGDRYAELLAAYRALLRKTFGGYGGHEVGVEGDSLFYAFPRAKDGLAAALAGQRSITSHPWPSDTTLLVRMGVHTGEPVEAAAGYIGLDVHLGARICAAGHGGQILVSRTTRELVREDSPAETILRDLGEHRLKDFDQPQRLFQVVAPGLRETFPPLNTLVIPHNLPAQRTSFIGREKELEEIKQLARSARLVTLTGPGGTGKTRLALQVATEVADHYPDGVWWVDLGPLSDPALVSHTIVSALALHRLNQFSADLPNSLVDYLRTKTLLVLLDNCEHLLLGCVEVADRLLTHCPHLGLLATSREALGIAGESVYVVPPLSVPNPREVVRPEQMAGYEAIKLFADRAIAADTTFKISDHNASAVVQICTRLDGMPLAIEMAAARARVLSVEDIAARLDDRFRLLTGGSRTALPRHQTLRATLDWSFALLSVEEQVLFRRLAVFSGGSTLEAVEAVCCGGKVDETYVFELLTQLVEKSLVIREGQNGQSRFRMLETIREYARGKLTEAAESERIAAQHLTYFSRLAVAVEQASVAFDPWLEQMDMEHDNLRTALEWAVEHHAHEVLVKMSAALWRFWFHRGHLAEGRQTLERALSFPETPPHLRAKALNGIAYLTMWMDGFKQAADFCEQSLALSRPRGDTETTALSAAIAGHAVWHTGDEKKALAFGEEGLALARKIGNAQTMLWALREYSYVMWHMGAIDQGEPLFAEYLTVARQIRNSPAAVDGLRLMAEASVHRGRHARAVQLCEEALAISLLQKDRIIGSVLRVCLGNALLAQGEYERAGRVYAETLPELEVVWQKWWLARCLEGLARVFTARQHYTDAVRLLGAADAIRESVGGSPAPPSDRAFLAKARAAAMEILGADAFTAAWADGRALTVTRAIEIAKRANDAKGR